MWLDAFLSVAFVAAGLVAAPTLAVLGVPDGARLAVGLIALVSAVLLATFGAITAVVLCLRMRDGDTTLPVGLWLRYRPRCAPSSTAAPAERRNAVAVRSSAG